MVKKYKGYTLAAKGVKGYYDDKNGPLVFQCPKGHPHMQTEPGVMVDCPDCGTRGGGQTIGYLNKRGNLVLSEEPLRLALDKSRHK